MEDGALPDDTRGIVDPVTMLRLVDFERYPVEHPALDGLVEWFWSVAWDLPDGHPHDQQVLNHPAGNVSIGTVDDAGVVLDPPEGRVYGVMSGLSHRRLIGRGWTVAARTTVGGLGALLGRPAKEVADRQLTLDEALPDLGGPDLGGPGLVSAVAATPDNPARVDLLRATLARAVEDRDPALVAEAREMVELARRIEHDRTLCRVEQVATVAGTSVRTLQRLFDTHVGASPSFVTRRWRIIEAAESAREARERGDEWRGWATVASELGYADQAHLVRDFGRHLGVSPAAYLANLGQGR